MAEASRRSRCNDRQKNHLVDALFANPELALGTLTSPMGVASQNREWAQLAEELANLGPRKSVEQWKITWRDLKSKAKTANAERAFALERETGNPAHPVPILTEINEKILGIIGRTTSEGMPGVPESRIRGAQPSPPNELHLEGGAEVEGENIPPQHPLPLVAGRPTRVRRQRRVVATTSRSSLQCLFEETQKQNLAVFKEISGHLKRRNEIEEDRNRILTDRNRLLEIRVFQGITVVEDQ